MLNMHQRDRLAYLQNLLQKGTLTAEDQLSLRVCYLYNYKPDIQEGKIPLDQIKEFKIDLGVSGNQIYLVFFDNNENERFLPLDIAYLSGRKRNVKRPHKKDKKCVCLTIGENSFIFTDRDALNSCITKVHASALDEYIQKNNCVIVSNKG